MKKDDYEFLLEHGGWKTPHGLMVLNPALERNEPLDGQVLKKKREPNARNGTAHITLADIL